MFHIHVNLFMKKNISSVAQLTLQYIFKKLMVVTLTKWSNKVVELSFSYSSEFVHEKKKNISSVAQLTIQCLAN